MAGYLFTVCLFGILTKRVVSESSIRVNCGGPSFTDSSNNEWLAGTSSQILKEGTSKERSRDYKRDGVSLDSADRSLYKHYTDDRNSVQYDIDVTGINENEGRYNVELFFAEPLRTKSAGDRLFDILVEGSVVLPAFDVYEEAGGRYETVSVLFEDISDDGDGIMRIECESITDRPFISGIAISSNGSAPTAPTPVPPTPAPTTPAPTTPAPLTPTSALPGVALFKVNCGGVLGEYGWDDANGWVSDDAFTSDGFKASRARSEFTLLGLFMYQSERKVVGSNPIFYSFDVANGDYTVELYFTEIRFDSANARLMDIYVEDMDVPVETGYDIFKKSGNQLKKPVVELYTVTVNDSDGLQIKLQADVKNAKINAIVISTLGEGPTPTTPTQSPTPRPTPMPPMPTPTPTPPTASPTPWDGGYPSETLGPTSDPGDSPGFVLRLNCGGPAVRDDDGRLWRNDTPWVRRREGIRSTNHPISGATFDTMYQSGTYGTKMTFRIAVPPGDYNVIFHFAEIEDVASGERIFDISAEDPLVVIAADIPATVGQFAAVSMNRYVPAVDELLVIRFLMKDGASFPPMVSGLEVIQNFPHLAHSVPGGPYMAVSRDNTGRALVPVNGGESHTHQVRAYVDSWKWFMDGVMIGEGETTNLSLDVGTHTVVLKIEDDDGNVNTDSTKVVVEPQGYPFIDSFTPESGDLGDPDFSITVTGVGFSQNDLVVHFGPLDLDAASEITIVSDRELILNGPIPSVRSTIGPVFLSVETARGISNTVTFTEGAAFFFDLHDIVDGRTNQPYYIFQPTCMAFGPDEKLYVGSRSGELHKLTLDENWVVTDSVVSTAVSDQSNAEDDEDRAILGMTFDPTDRSDPPTLYVSTSILSHDEPIAWRRLAVNGRVVTVTGANLDRIRNVVTGLPILDRDHSVNGLEFGNHGELYINNGGNTNAGVPGFMSGTQVQEEGLLSAACNVAYLSKPDFDGSVTYGNNGDQTGGWDVETFAAGTRNPYDLVMHSNGHIYGTDNGPNKIYGAASVDCDSEGWAEPAGDDELNLLERGGYYGHPNRKRGEDDPRQCTYHHPDDGSGSGFTGPMATFPSSVDGIIEFQSNHFGGTLRGQLIIGQFRGAMYRAALTPDGRDLVNNEVVAFLNFGGLDVTQAPDGSLASIRYNDNKVIVQVPIDPVVSTLEVKAVFPHRGPLDGGSTLFIYGVNMNTGARPTVTVGGRSCTSVSVVSSTKWSCTLPSSATPSKADVVVENGIVREIFTDAYRYIAGE